MNLELCGLQLIARIAQSLSAVIQTCSWKHTSHISFTHLLPFLPQCPVGIMFSKGNSLKVIEITMLTICCTSSFVRSSNIIQSSKIVNPSASKVLILKPTNAKPFFGTVKPSPSMMFMNQITLAIITSSLLFLITSTTLALSHTTAYVETSLRYASASISLLSRDISLYLILWLILN